MKRFFLTLLALVVIVTGSALGGAYLYFTGSIPLTAEKTVLIERGTGRIGIAKKLAEEGVIKYPEVFAVVGYAMGKKPILAGEYAFGPGMTPWHVLQRLQSGKVVLRKVTLPEGYTVWQALQLVDKAEGLTGELPTDVTEGSLFPETYYFVRGDSKSSIISRMQEKQQQVIQELPGLSPDLITLASIVEKETGVMDERARIAGVFLNRLRKGMLLQTDPTVLYAVSDKKGVLDRPLTLRDLAVDSPYNTYKNPGLPPGPICNPGRAALEAVLKPADTKDLFFVASGNGGHSFSETLAGHNRNVGQYRANLRKQKEEAASAQAKPQPEPEPQAPVAEPVTPEAVIKPEAQSEAPAVILSPDPAPAKKL